MTPRLNCSSPFALTLVLLLLHLGASSIGLHSFPLTLQSHLAEVLVSLLIILPVQLGVPDNLDLVIILLCGVPGRGPTLPPFPPLSSPPLPAPLLLRR